MGIWCIGDGKACADIMVCIIGVVAAVMAGPGRRANIIYQFVAKYTRNTGPMSAGARLLGPQYPSAEAICSHSEPYGRNQRPADIIWPPEEGNSRAGNCR